MKRGRFYTGLFLLTLSTLMLEIVQTRLLSVMTWYHLAFFVISASMFGMTGGAVWVYLQGKRFDGANLARDLSLYASCFALTTAVSLMIQVTLAPVTAFSLAMPIVFMEMAIVTATPFFFSGVAVTLALTRGPFPVGLTYAADLAGAALGCLGVLVLLDRTDAPSAILLIGAVAASAAILFEGAGAREPRRGAPAIASLVLKPWPLAVLLAILGLANGMTHHGIQPLLVKGEVESRRDELRYERWNSFSRVTAAAPGSGIPSLWGPSARLPNRPVEQITMNIDGLAGSTMFRFDGSVNGADFLRFDVTNLAYFLRHSGRAAIIGVGSGRDLLSAWTFGSRDVTGVEINPIFIDLLTKEDRFARFAGLDSLNGMRLISDEARSWFARTPERFDLIQMSMIDTWAATGAGAFTLSENGLYTLEAWRIFLRRLTDGGVFTVSRWYSPGEVNESGRMISLALATLFEEGVPHPPDHVFVGASQHVASLIVSRQPLTPSEVEVLRQACDRYGYRILVSPGLPDQASPVLSTMLEARGRQDLERYTAGLDLDLTPPTDDRPFFFNVLPLRRPQVVMHLPGAGAGIVTGNLVATFSLLTILVTSVVLVATTIIVPLRPAVRDAGRPLAIGGTVYFALLGAGFMSVEMGLLQRMSVLLGHPVYSLSVVLFSLILSTGAGSLLSETVKIERSRRLLVFWSLLVGSYVMALPLWLQQAASLVERSPIGVRAAFCVAFIAPAGIMMGFGFPAGMRLSQTFDRRPSPWFWGINGAAGVLASVLAVAVSMAFGISATIVLGGLCYLGLAPAALAMQAGKSRDGGAAYLL